MSSSFFKHLQNEIIWTGGKWDDEKIVDNDFDNNTNVNYDGDDDDEDDCYPESRWRFVVAFSEP